MCPQGPRTTFSIYGWLPRSLESSVPLPILLMCPPRRYGPSLAFFFVGAVRANNYFETFRSASLFKDAGMPPSCLRTYQSSPSCSTKVRSFLAVGSRFVAGTLSESPFFFSNSIGFFFRTFHVRVLEHPCPALRVTSHLYDPRRFERVAAPIVLDGPLFPRSSQPPGVTSPPSLAPRRTSSSLIPDPATAFFPPDRKIEFCLQPIFLVLLLNYHPRQEE